MRTLRPRSQRGFTIIEALIALLVMAFGMLSLAGMQVMLSRNGDFAKQRAEALRLAQDRLERLRAFDGVGSGTIDWNNLPVAAETFNGNTNATFTVTGALAGATTDAMRPLTITVAWTDRTGTAQTLVLPSVISKTNPETIGLVANPLPLNQPLRRPKNRNINIPIPAIDLGNGESATQFSPTFAIVYSNTTGGVVRLCTLPNITTATADDINDAIDANACTSVTGYIVAGYIRRSDSSITWPTGIAHGITRINDLAGQPIRCLFTDAIDQNTQATIANYKYYLCVVPLAEPSDGTAARWGGTIKLGDVVTTSDYVVCRYQYTQTDIDTNERNVQPYVNVAKSIDEQNYWITNSSSTDCTTISTNPPGLNMTGVSQGVLHQNCRSSNSANHATECPVTSP
ncbi:MAG TPA: prepilin-type N-terminal cleavage/methylation domain-containing protein [Methylibium sp.]|nr:prepilin-type N-terminal cleavage/methylation domain-containing protein [Methylibium sp.]